MKPIKNIPAQRDADYVGFTSALSAPAGAGVSRPKYSVCDPKTALAFDWRGWHLSEKMDGVWDVRTFSGWTITGEAMPDGRFFAFDIIADLPWIEREKLLTELFARIGSEINWHRCATGAGAEFIEAVLARGGEGVVAKPFASYFGFDWVKVKKVQTEDCLVTEIHTFKRSVRLSQNGVDRGWCSVGSNKISAGCVIEIAAYGLTENGKFREPRFVRTRPDKSSA